jgi:hypothetical protein
LFASSARSTTDESDMIKALVPEEGQDAIDSTMVRQLIKSGAAARDTTNPSLMTQTRIL